MPGWRQRLALSSTLIADELNGTMRGRGGEGGDWSRNTPSRNVLRKPEMSAAWLVCRLYLYLDGMLVHHTVIPSIKFVDIHL